MVRYEFRFDTPELCYRGLRVQFLKDFDHASDVEILANYPHQQRRTWARAILQEYHQLGDNDNHPLTNSHFRSGYGLRVKQEFPGGATVSILKPNTNDRYLLLIIQVGFIPFILFYFSLTFINR